jgi:hypothetical protein
VADDVGIAVSLQPHVPGKLDTTEHQPAPHHQPVQVESGPYSQIRPVSLHRPI